MVFFQSIQTYAQVIYETKYGDTLTNIAIQYKTKPEAIAKLNGLKKDAHLVVGQALLISGSSCICSHKRNTVYGYGVIIHGQQ
ncbi:LysM peptidoglycan-binding domain-containing protein [Neobacillus sp. GCM10023253]